MDAREMATKLGVLQSKYQRGSHRFGNNDSFPPFVDGAPCYVWVHHFLGDIGLARHTERVETVRMFDGVHLAFVDAALRFCEEANPRVWAMPEVWRIMSRSRDVYDRAEEGGQRDGAGPGRASLGESYACRSTDHANQEQ